MSRLRRAVELRGLTSYQSEPFPLTAPDVAGSTGWQSGMVWRGAGPGAIDTDEAMRLSAVFACVRLLSEAISTLPLDTYMRLSGTRAPYRPKPTYLTFQPPQGSKIDYLSQVMLSLLSAGDSYILTPRDPLGVPLTLVVTDPTLWTVQTVEDEYGRKRDEWRCNGVKLIPDWDFIHIKGMCMPGAATGMSPIAYAAEAINLGLSAQRYGEGFFANGALPAAVIEAPEAFGTEAQNRFVDGWNARHRGTSNSSRIGVLTKGAKLTKVSITPDEAQFLQTRQFQVPDIARIFGVPPHLIADASNSTSWGSGLAEQNSAFGQFSLRPWIERIEDAHTRLLTTHGMPDVFVKLNLDALLRADTKERMDAYAVAIEHGVMTPNEARKLEDMPPVSWGDAPPSAPAPPVGDAAL